MHKEDRCGREESSIFQAGNSHSRKTSDSSLRKRKKRYFVTRSQVDDEAKDIGVCNRKRVRVHDASRTTERVAFSLTMLAPNRSYFTTKVCVDIARER